jgi:hypothetical protein
MRLAASVQTTQGRESYSAKQRKQKLAIDVCDVLAPDQECQPAAAAAVDFALARHSNDASSLGQQTALLLPVFVGSTTINIRMSTLLGWMD